MLYTSYFNKVARLNDQDLIYVSIAQGKPYQGFNHEYLTISWLAPTWSLIMDWKNNRISWEEYTQRYYEETKVRENRNKLLQVLNQIQEEEHKPVVLLCHYKDYEHCHRSLVGNLLGAKELVPEVDLCDLGDLGFML